MITLEYYNDKHERVKTETYDNQDAAYVMLKIRDWENVKDNYCVTIM